MTIALINNIKNKVFPLYEKNDPAHKWNHAEAVMELALKINEKLKLELPENSIITASLLHDIYIHEGRDAHHIAAATGVLSRPEMACWFKELNREFNFGDSFSIVYAIYEHRASYSGDFTSPLSELVSSADRLEPDERRLMNRMIEVYGADFENGYCHILNKFIKGGYARWPKMYTDYFGERFNEYQKNLADREYMYNVFLDIIKP